MGPVNRIIEQGKKHGGRVRLIGLVKRAILADEGAMLRNMYNFTRDPSIGVAFPTKIGLTDEKLNHTSEWYAYNSLNIQNAMRAMVRAAMAAATDERRSMSDNATAREFWFSKHPTRMDGPSELWFGGDSRQLGYTMLRREPLYYTKMRMFLSGTKFTKEAPRHNNKWNIQPGYYIRILDPATLREATGLLHFVKLDWAAVDTDASENEEDEDDDNLVFNEGDAPHLFTKETEEDACINKVIAREFKGIMYRGKITSVFESDPSNDVFMDEDIDEMGRKELQRHAKRYGFKANDLSKTIRKNLKAQIAKRDSQDEEEWDPQTTKLYNIQYDDGDSEDLDWDELLSLEIDDSNDDWKTMQKNTAVQGRSGRSENEKEFLFYRASWDILRFTQSNIDNGRSGSDNNTLYKIRLSKWNQLLRNGGFHLFTARWTPTKSPPFAYRGWKVDSSRDKRDMWSKMSDYISLPNLQPEYDIDRLSSAFKGIIRGQCGQCGHFVYDNQRRVSNGTYWHSGCRDEFLGIPLRSVEMTIKLAKANNKRQRPSDWSGIGSEFNLSFSRLHVHL